MKLRQITPEFVDEIPRELDPGRLYVCCQYRAVKHLCACGCGVAINTPLHPTGWTLSCDGVSVSLWPSIGNWNEECQSHYWIRNSKIHWAPKWSKPRILKGRKARDLELDRYFELSTSLEMNQPRHKDFHKPTFQRGWLTRLIDRLARRK